MFPPKRSSHNKTGSGENLTCDDLGDETPTKNSGGLLAPPSPASLQCAHRVRWNSKQFVTIQNNSKKQIRCKIRDNSKQIKTNRNKFETIRNAPGLAARRLLACGGGHCFVGVSPGVLNKFETIRNAPGLAARRLLACGGGHCFVGVSPGVLNKFETHLGLRRGGFLPAAAAIVSSGSLPAS
jgi:hypothetical protein